LDSIFPKVNRLFSSPPKSDGSEKWVDFVSEFWHCQCVCGLSPKRFSAKYQKWCKSHRYNFSEDKAVEIYNFACRQVSILPKNAAAKLLVKQAVSQLQAAASTLAALRKEMQTLSADLPEYPVVMKMFGVGPFLNPQLMA